MVIGEKEFPVSVGDPPVGCASLKPIDLIVQATCIPWSGSERTISWEVDSAGVPGYRQ